MVWSDLWDDRRLLARNQHAHQPLRLGCIFGGQLRNDRVCLVHLSYGFATSATGLHGHQRAGDLPHRAFALSVIEGVGVKKIIALFVLAMSGVTHAAQLETLDCLVIGDSIAVGVSQFSECNTASANSVSSKTWLSRYYYVLYYPAKSVFIALGTNDDFYPESKKTLRQIRQNIRSQKVTWLAPNAARPGRKAVDEIAHEFGDEVYEGPRSSLGPDGIHFTRLGYQTIAGNLK